VAFGRGTRLAGYAAPRALLRRAFDASVMLSSANGCVGRSVDEAVGSAGCSGCTARYAWPSLHGISSRLQAT
jgi:hypothetical protein